MLKRYVLNLMAFDAVPMLAISDVQPGVGGTEHSGVPPAVDGGPCVSAYDDPAARSEMGGYLRGSPASLLPAEKPARFHLVIGHAGLPMASAMAASAPR